MMELTEHLVVEASKAALGTTQVEVAGQAIRILTISLSIPAVDDLGFHRMHFEMALCQTGLKCGLEGLGFLLSPAMNQSIVCIPAPWEVWVCPCHPKIKRVMHK